MAFACMASFLLFSWIPAFRSGVRASPLLFCKENQWWISCRIGDGRGRFNKFACRITHFADREKMWCCSPLAGRGGEERRWCCCSSSRSTEWLAGPWVSWSWFVLAFERGAGRRLRCISGRFPWWKPKQGLRGVSSFIKRCCLFLELGARWLHLPPAGRGGEGRKGSCSSFLASVERPLLHLCAPHAVALLAAAIYGHEGGQSSTSASEACLTRRRSSAPRCSQVVSSPAMSCVPASEVIRRKGEPECLMELRSRRSHAWRSPTAGGGEDPGLHCFSFFSSRVFFASFLAFSSNLRSSRAIDEKGRNVICTCHGINW